MVFTPEQIGMLAKQERDMDSGKVFFVVFGGSRLAVQDDVATELGLERGQTISDTIFTAILEAQLASVQAQIALNKTLTA